MNIEICYTDIEDYTKSFIQILRDLERIKSMRFFIHEIIKSMNRVFDRSIEQDIFQRERNR